VTKGVGSLLGLWVFCAEPERTAMIYKILGKKIYPDLTRRERRRRINNILGLVFAAVISGASAGYVIYRENFSHR
jgi:hypothetical protein